MDRKKILGIPEAGAEETGRYIRAMVADETLVLDCYEGRKYIGRYCMQKDGRYDFYSARERKWQKKQLNTVFGSPWYSYNDTKIKCDSVSCAVIEEFTGDVCYNGARSVRDKEQEYMRDKRQRAYDNKCKMIDALMEKVPVLPDGFYGWLNNTVFGGKEYMFRIAGNEWKCTACGKTHTSKKPYKNNQMVKCSRTGKQAMVKSMNQPIKKREPVMIFQTMDKRRSVARHLVAERVWSSEECGTEAYENVRYILGKNTVLDRLSGDIVPNVRWYYGQHHEADEFAQDWWDTNPKNKRCNVEYCYPVGVKEALKNTLYERMHLETFAELGWKLQYNKMMINYDTCGFMEYLAKAGLRKFTQEASDNFSVYGGYWDRKILNIHGKNASEVLGINMQRFYRLRQNDGGYLYLKWLIYEQETGKKIPEKTIAWMDRNKISPEGIRFIKDRMSPVQVENYLERQQKLYKKTPNSLIEYWKDYLYMAKRLEMDTDDEIVYRAKYLLQRHDELVEVLNQMDVDKQAEIMRAKYPDAERILQGIKERYEYENKDYILKVPGSIQDIMRDGRQLHHCAASSERYFERINKNETYIMFLRKKSRPLAPWYTLEVEPGGTVRQKRSEYNRQPEINAVKKFLAEWQQVLKQRMKQEDRELAAESRRNRIMEMEELKKNNDRFAGVLEADLMEVV